MSDHLDSKRAMRAVTKALKPIKELLDQKDREIREAKNNAAYWEEEHGKLARKYDQALRIDVRTNYHVGPHIKACTMELDTNCAKFGDDLEKLAFIVAREIIRQIKLGQ